MDNDVVRHFPVDGPINAKFLAQLAHSEKMAELGRLSVGMVHELNSPLSVIASAVQLILREDHVPVAIQEMVERIDEEIQRLSQLTRGVLSFARNDDEPEAEADVNQVLRDVLSFLRYEARKKSIGIIEEMDYSLPVVSADVNRLKQIFINLILNAFQAMDQGGALQITTSLHDDRRVRVEISDTGKGIPPEAIDHIFEPFYTTKKEGEGTGLGLFIVRKMVELMHARIDVASTIGDGTTFTLEFPVS